MKYNHFVSLGTCLQLVLSFSTISRASAVQSPTVITTSGRLVGLDDGAGVISFKKVPYAQPPTGSQRWKPPAALVSGNTVDASALGPSCLQQFPLAGQAATIPLFNTPPPPSENEDCLFLNVWAPASIQGPLKAVIFWIHGGALSFGSASLPYYDGTSLAQNQDVVVVTINYRTNVFGFPFGSDAAEIPLNQRNLGLLDQELALQWVRLNIHAFGGDANRIALMGQSAGASSVTWLLQRHPINPPFQSAILLSSVFSVEVTPTTNEQAWTAFATAVGCAGSAGVQRLTCLKQVSASTIHNFFNGPNAPPVFSALIDNITVFANPIQRILDHKVARVPILQGNMENDASVFVLGQSDVGTFLNNTFGPGVITPAAIAPLYPGLSGFSEISQIDRDFSFICPASLHTSAYARSGMTNVFRYIYGAVFADLQLFPGIGAWHGSELPELFGTYNRTSATASEVQLSSTFQTIVASFAKNPFVSPVPSWPKYNPNSTTLANLAFNGNVALNNVVQTTSTAQLDEACAPFWDSIVLLPPTGAGAV
ncbi:hypothetical protein PILCRDRAFT_13689 [Piloderma croceum F 1598]|uniref:Carboxylic ester hydrolase n=1 Tax=Piloderma croceum (strain F 1598) TaxID=765440 RepID=A0A0C3ERS9_PILCF|nr:hypothetical protein PILCRDRAFT_13689 [Piloderma croceum F 1598]